MRRALQILSVLLLLATLGTWFALGANRGWTKTSVAVKTPDPVTGIDGISYQKKFLPGVEFLAVGIFGAFILGGVSLFVRKPTKNQ